MMSNSVRKRKRGGDTTTVDENDLLGGNLSFYASEAYARLRTNLGFASVGKDKQCRIIGVTSSMRGEGKTTTSINLAYALAKDGKSVVLVDGDLRLPMVANNLKIKQKPGFSNLLVGEQSNVLQKTELHENLFVIAAGDLPPNPSELLGSERCGESLRVIKSKVDYLILDLPPIAEVTDALVASRHLDGLIVVVRRNYATKRVLNATIRQIRQVDGNLLGFVMTYGENFSKKYGRKGYGYYKKKNSSDN